MLGRHREMELLRDRMSQTAAGLGSIFLIEGAAGTGKSRLLDELALVCQHSHLSLLRGEARRTGPLFAQALDGVGSIDGAGDEDDWVSTSLTRLIHHTDHQPTIVLLDDIHRADDASLLLLLKLGRSCLHRPLMIVATYRPGEGAEPVVRSILEQFDRTIRLGLQPLSRRSCDRLIDARLRPCEIDDDLRDRLHLHSGGVPAFLLATIDRMQETGQLRREDGVWLNGLGSEDLDVPDVQRTALTEHLEGLDGAERRCLAHAAIQGCRFTGAAVAWTLDAELMTTLRRLARLQRRGGLIEADDRGFRFTQPALAILCRQDLTAEQTRAVHRALIAYRGPAPDGEDDVERRARHLLGAGETARSLPYLMTAARRAHRAGEVHRARRLFRRTLDVDGQLRGLLGVSDRCRLLLGLAECDLALGRPREARAWCDRVLTRKPGGGAEADAHLLIARAWQQQGRWQEARDAAEAARDPQPPSAAPQERLAAIACERSRLAEAASHLTRGRQPAEEPDGEPQRIRARLAAHRGSYVEAVVRLSKTLRHPRTDADAAGAYVELGSVHLEQGQHRPAQACFERALDRARGAGHPILVAQAALGLARVEAARGNPEQARDYRRRSSALLSRCDAPADEAATALVEGQILRHESRLDEAEHVLTDCRRRLDDLDSRLGVAACDRELGLVLRQRGDTAGAQRYLTSSLRGFQEAGAIADALKTNRLLTTDTTR